jgi:hypothetical protein
VPTADDAACRWADALPRRLVDAALTAASALDRRVELLVPEGASVGDSSRARWSSWAEASTEAPIAKGLARRLVRGPIAECGIETMTAESLASADGEVHRSLLVRAPTDALVAAAIAAARTVEGHSLPCVPLQVAGGRAR